MTEDPSWRKSTYSGSEGDNCVEVALRRTHVTVRDSKDKTRRPLSLAPRAWTAFTAHTLKKRGDL